MFRKGKSTQILFLLLIFTIIGFLVFIPAQEIPAVLTSVVHMPPSYGGYVLLPCPVVWPQLKNCGGTWIVNFTDPYGGYINPIINYMIGNYAVTPEYSVFDLAYNPMLAGSPMMGMPYFGMISPLSLYGPQSMVYHMFQNAMLLDLLLQSSGMSMPATVPGY